MVQSCLYFKGQYFDLNIFRLVKISYFFLDYRNISQKGTRESGKTTLNAFMTKALLNRNQFIDLLCKSIDWFLYDRKLRYERVKLYVLTIISIETSEEAYLELCQAVKMELFGEIG